jgi:hypothetical protein
VRIKSVVSLVLTVVMVTVGAVVGPASPAAATDALARCRAGDRPQYSDTAWWQAPGNQHTPWAAPAGIVDGDVFRVTAYGTVRIDFWGTNKSINGELPGAPANWPSPGERRYMLVASISAGTLWSDWTRRTYAGNSKWLPVGFDSGCFQYWSAGDPHPLLRFSYNDDNLGDNGGGAWIVVQQWW